MARSKRGRPKASPYRYRNFDKTYRRYKREYFKAARRRFKSWKRKLTESEMEEFDVPTHPTNAYLEGFMKDTLESRADFRTDYLDYKKDLISEGKETADPIQYIVADQTYEFSRKQYSGFKKAVKQSEFEELTGMDLSKVSREEFLTGEWRNEDFFKAADKYYWEMKQQALAAGKSEKAAWMEAQAKVSALFFGRVDEDGNYYYGDSK